MVDIILDRAGQKGTGLWTAVEARRLGTPVTTGRSRPDRAQPLHPPHERASLEAIYGPAPRKIEDDGLQPQIMLREALIAGKIIAYAQGFALIDAASRANGWEVNLAAVAKVWRSGCIIRSRLLDNMTDALSFERITAPAGDAPVPLLTKEPFVGLLKDTDAAFRGTVATAAVYGLPAPALSAALSWFDMARTGRGTANLIQAQRDFFGAHGFERTDREGVGITGTGPSDQRSPRLRRGVFFLILSPGPGVLSTAGVGSAFGYRPGLRYVFGLFLGTNAVCIAVITGVATVVLASQTIRTVLLILSAGYLLYLAAKVAFAGSKIAFIQADRAPGIRDALLLQALNPKAYVVNTTMIAGFPLGFESLGAEIAVKLLVMNIIWIPLHLLWLWFGVVLRLLDLAPQTQRKINYAMASAMVLVVGMALWSLRGG